MRSLRDTQTGAALLALVALLATGMLVALMSGLGAADIRQQRERRTEMALGEAKAALIAWSLTRDESASGKSRPGELPCPDTDAPGDLNYGVEEGTCAAGSVGRLPWRTLGIPEPLDGYAEPLRYGISAAFRRRWGASASTNQPINSDTAPVLTTYQGTGVSAAQFSAAAMLFSVGNGAQRALAVSAADVIRPVERKVLRTASNMLTQYALANGGTYPNPSSTACNATPTPLTPVPCAPDPTICFGRFPETTITFPGISLWFQTNGWGRTLMYAVAKSKAADGSSAQCVDNLAVAGVAGNRHYILIAPGVALAGQTRTLIPLSNRLEDPANYDAWGGNPSFVLPGTASNDQLRSSP